MIITCVCDEEFDIFCCRFTRMSRVMEHGGCHIASPAWQTKSLGARRQYSQATVNNVLPLMTDMMWIFFIDWQQYWKCDWTMNIGANRNAHGKRTVSTKQPQVKDLTIVNSWASWLWRGTGIELVFESLNCFTVRPIFSTRPITRIKFFIFFFHFHFFFFWGGWGVVSSNAFTIRCCIPISSKAAEGN